MLFPVRLLLWGFVLACLAARSTSPAQAQAPLFLVNDETTVSDLSFRFTSTQTFDEDRLEEQIATAAPGFLDAVKRIIPVILPPDVYLFDPIELQKDVVRLRRFYHRNGFLQPEIDYAASQFDTTDNAIHVIFSVEEGPPLIIQDVSFLASDSTSYAVSQFEGRLRREWIRFRDRTAFQRGERYTEINRLRIEEHLLTWLRNRGFAFARIGAETVVDTAASAADIRFFVDAGPRGRITEISIQGNEALSTEVVKRELPFSEGDLFAQHELAQGQRELFGLNLFRLALVEVPPQPRDSTVTVRVRVREADPRYVGAETGYARNVGLTAQAQWSHRNFFGGARDFSVNLRADTGIWAVPTYALLASRLFRASVSLRQPYLFTTRLSGSVSPFVQLEKNPLLRENEEAFLDINAFEFGLGTTLIYQFLPLRTMSLQHTISRASQLTSRLPDTTDVVQPEPGEPGVPGFTDLGTRDIFNKNILTLNGTFGRTDSRINPLRGFLVLPTLEFGGPSALSGVEYLKLGGEVSGYLPLSDRISLTGRLDGGRIWPYGASAAQLNPRIEDRFDNIRYYGGGASDVRGWAYQLLGPKVNHTEFVRENGRLQYPEGCDPQADPDGCLPRTTDERYEAVGGLAKLAGSVELRLPFPGLGATWRTALFLDFGQVSADRNPDFDPAVDPQRLRFTDDGTLDFNPAAFQYGVGAGVRYRTPVGYLRLDLAFKLNPDRQDFLSPRQDFLVQQGYLDDPEERFIRRFNVHLSIGQAF